MFESLDNIPGRSYSEMPNASFKNETSNYTYKNLGKYSDVYKKMTGYTLRELLTWNAVVWANPRIFRK